MNDLDLIDTLRTVADEVRALAMLLSNSGTQTPLPRGLSSLLDRIADTCDAAAESGLQIELGDETDQAAT